MLAPPLSRDASTRPLNSLGLAKAPADTRVVVAMSGGVDSSVVAALLARDGYDVVGVTMQLYDHGAATHRKGACCAGQDIHDARDVAARLGIPHYVLDYETPLPREGDRAVRARLCRGRDADSLRRLQPAHEIRRPVRGRQGPRRRHPGDRPLRRVATTTASGGRALYRAADPDRDQSYFLFATTREQLAMLRFPLGALPKPRGAGAGRANSAWPSPTRPTARTSASCPAGHYSEMIERLLPGAAEAGDIVHIDGRVLGRHAGVLHYTIGQRRGLGIAAAEPLYVVALDARAPRVVVGPRQALETHRIRLRDVNWIGDGELADIPARRPGDRGARALDPPAGAGASAARRRGRIRRAGERRLAGAGLRVLRVVRPARARARRRVHRRDDAIGGRRGGGRRRDALVPE